MTAVSTSPLKPLRGVRVLSLALNLPGPAAFMRLKALGATCLKVEPPGPKSAPAGTSGDDYAQDPRILIILTARLSSQTRPLQRRTAAELDAMNPDWRNETKGTPRYFCTDYSEGLITLTPGSGIDDTLNLSVIRLPLAQMVLTPSVAGPPATGLYASPEINFRHHFRLLDGMLARAYQKEDSEALDPQKAARHASAWLKHLSAMTMGRIRLHEAESFAGPPRGIK